MSENDVELYVDIVNLRYKLVGFNAIKDFKEWLDNNASCCTNGNGICEVDYPQPIRTHNGTVATSTT
jgi:hypothetical protein